MSETVNQKIERLEAEVASLKVQLSTNLVSGQSPNAVEEPGTTVTVGDGVRTGELPSEAEIDQLLALVERAGQVPRLDAEDRADFRRSFATSIRFLASVGRLDVGVNQRINAHEWALEGQRFMSQLGCSVTLTNGGLWAAALACGVSWQRGYQDRGVPARLGLVWDSGAPRAHTRWRQVPQQGKPLSPIALRLDPLPRAQAVW